MTDRYSLRLETGGRAGELIPLTHSPFLIGRSQECNLRLTEASVSGRHAELRIKGELISLHDLGSTNGTRIGRLKIGEAELEPGLAFSVGDVRMTLVLQGAAGAPPAKSAPAPAEDEILLEEPTAAGEPSTPEPVRPSGDFASEAVQTKIQPGWEDSLGSEELLDQAGHVSADQLARASRRSPVALAGLAALLLAAGGAFFMWGQGAGEGPAAAEELTEAGDLLRGAGTFEKSEDSAWSARDGWNGLFRRSRSAASKGAAGLTCELVPGERAQHLGPVTKIPARQAFDLGAVVRVEGDAVVRLGLRWTVQDSLGEDAPPTVQATTAWGPIVGATDGFQEYRLKGAAPDGYAYAQVCIAAWGQGAAGEPGEDVAGRVDVDSVVWLGTGTGSAAVSLHEMEGFVQGEPSTSFVLHKIDRVLLSGVACLGERPGFDAMPVPIELQSHDHGMLLSRVDAGAGQWIFTATPRLANLGVSTMGGAGYLARSLDFKDPAVTDLVLGSGTDLIRISFDGPAAVSGGPRSGSYRFSVQVPAGRKVLIKTEFGDELKAAVALAASAQTATREGRVGEALDLWKQLLDRYPYEASDVMTADTARSTLLRDGRLQIKTLRGELERARFFQLRTGFEICWQEASRLKTRYAGSELEAPLGDILNDIQVAREKFPEEAKLGQGYKEALVHVLRKRGAVELASKAQATATPNNTQQGN